MHPLGAEDNIHIAITVHIRYHQFAVFNSSAFKVKNLDSECIGICQLPESPTGKLIDINSICINQADICLTISVIIHRNQTVGFLRHSICLIPHKVETAAVIYGGASIQIYQQSA